MKELGSFDVRSINGMSRNRNNYIPFQVKLIQFGVLISSYRVQMNCMTPVGMETAKYKKFIIFSIVYTCHVTK